MDPHYTFLYEYKTVTATGARNTGFANTTAASVGVNANITKSLNTALDVWYLLATDKDSTPIALQTNDMESSSNIGVEVDLAINWKIYNNLSWNWLLGYFKPGAAMRVNVASATSPADIGTVGNQVDAVTGVQGVLNFSF